MNQITSGFFDGTPPDGNSSAVRTRIMAMIAGNCLGPGGRLPPERELSETLGVGRRTVRRALEALEAEGLIWRRQGKGTFAGQAPDPTGVLAAEITGDTGLEDIMEARLCIEPTLAGMCARNALPADIERLRHLAQRVHEAADQDSIDLWDGALHRLIARIAGNRPLMTAVALIDEIRGSDRWRDRRCRPGSHLTPALTDAQHHDIINAIETGQPQLAEAAMRKHLLTLAASLEHHAEASEAVPVGETR
ncbi:MAG: FadR/GntR family transcriptional regulator [Hoeflea sp.]|uniref:FadR/GntR family transcriptional regulator n=1 Tax=Hoeflea sp. TaxID=1940281 RepID=UPI003EF4801D